MKLPSVSSPPVDCLFLSTVGLPPSGEYRFTGVGPQLEDRAKFQIQDTASTNTMTTAPEPYDYTTSVLDPIQLKRIENIHRGFLYQHLYLAGCLLLAGQTGADYVLVEGDEDIEISFDDKKFYIQVKTRSASLNLADIGDTLRRFRRIREEHDSGARPWFTKVLHSCERGSGTKTQVPHFVRGLVFGCSGCHSRPPGAGRTRPSTRVARYPRSN